MDWPLFSWCVLGVISITLYRECKKDRTPFWVVTIVGLIFGMLFSLLMPCNSTLTDVTGNVKSVSLPFEGKTYTKALYKDKVYEFVWNGVDLAQVEHLKFSEKNWTAYFGGLVKTEFEVEAVK